MRDRLDAAIGEGVDRLVVSHHRRRLARRGHLGVLDAPAGGWAESASQPRAGNEVELLVDGEEALACVAAAIRAARVSIELAGWHVDPDFRLEHGGPTVRELLADAASRVEVRVLVWAGSPLPLFHPDRGEVRDATRRLREGTSIRVGLDRKERPMHCHHEKIVVVDGEVAFVGGIDLTGLGGDRLDDPQHPVRSSLGWHDATSVLRGPIVADVLAHLRLRWRETTGEALPQPEPPEPAGETEVQLVRTVPERVYRALPNGEFSILESYLRALRSAERLVYLESQFLWSQELVDVLADKLRRPPSDDFRLLALLPAHPKNGQEDTRGQLAQLLAADGGNRRLLACALYQRGVPRPNPIYVHAKIGIVDDRWLTIGSANLNEHSLFNDTEANVVVHEAAFVRAARLRLWAEHLERDADDVAGDPARLVDELWRPLAENGNKQLDRGQPLEHKLVELPGVSRHSRRLLGPLNGLLVDG